ncbi:MAG: RES family NAD+ phosphorylase, partial [Cyanobacteria bacterium SZAS LIN-2]|nr:RES family NAD+ phosphorylase [Cyanobacteria bacterium SZAS LIN-2]
PAFHQTQALTFRTFGPLRRFDHQQKTNGKPAQNSERGILYAGESISGCIVEIFGDTGIIEVGTWEVALLQTKRTLNLLDLRGDGAMKAGTVAGVCKDSDHGISQRWSQYFYETECMYGVLDGLLYGNAHNDEQALALYERAKDGLKCLMTTPLKNEQLRSEVLLIASEFGLIVEPY